MGPRLAKRDQLEFVNGVQILVYGVQTLVDRAHFF